MSKSGGNMYKSFLGKIRETAIAAVPAKDKVALQYLLGEIKTINFAKLPKAKGPGVAWTVESALKMLNEKPLKHRNLANGKKMFSAGMCIVCHNFANEGGGVGPDLNNLAKRSDYKSILESILKPNLVVSDQFEQHELKMKDGSTVLGRVVFEKDGVISLVQSGFAPNQLTKVNKADVVSSKGSKLSMMPPGLINTMNAEELKDLIAYFVTQGNPRHKIYKKALKKLKIKLIRAVYGQAANPKQQVDVLKQVQALIDKKDYQFTVSNTLATKDPAPGIPKVLELTYEIKGKKVTKTIKEKNKVSW